MAKQQPKTEKSVISVLLPTRGRREVLRKSLDSLVSKASNPERLEILFGVDEDDQTVIDYIKEEIAEDLKEVGIEARASIFKPLGYENLHIYVNTRIYVWLHGCEHACLRRHVHSCGYVCGPMEV